MDGSILRMLTVTCERSTATGPFDKGRLVWCSVRVVSVTAELMNAVCPASFGAVVAAYEATERYVERRCERRQRPLVDALARLEPLNYACRDAGFHCKLVDAVAACNPKAEGPRR